MADSTIDGLPTIGSVDRSTDKLAIWDSSDSLTGEMTINSMLGFSGGNPVSTSDSQTLTNKTVTSPTITVLDNALTLQDNSDPTKQAQFQLSGITAGQTRVMTLPDASTTLVGTGATQTLTNKTLTSPTINTATIANPTLTIDAISEYTGAAGVTIDGMLIKDGTVGAGTITPAGLVSGTGSSWAWQTWSPNLTNLAGGTQTIAKYVQIGKTVFFNFEYTLGGAGVSGSVSFSLPVAATLSSTLELLNGRTHLVDTGTQAYVGVVRFASSTTATIFVEAAGGTYTTTSTVLSSTVPHTWANTDVIFVTGIYEAA